MANDDARPRPDGEQLSAMLRGLPHGAARLAALLALQLGTRPGALIQLRWDTRPDLNEASDNDNGEE